MRLRPILLIRIPGCVIVPVVVLLLSLTLTAMSAYDAAIGLLTTILHILHLHGLLAPTFT